jgi:hypothetical protein
MALSKNQIPFEVLIWTSSHGTSFHHFPINLGRAYQDCQHQHKNLILEPFVNAVPGRCMKPGFYREVETDFERIEEGTRRMNIILMGDNDVRCLAFPGSYRVIKQSERLVELHKNTPHALVLCGLLPSPATHNITSRLFDITSRNLKDICEQSHTSLEGQFISYLKVSHLFNDQDGLIDYQTYFEPDGVHLNPTGAYQLAQHLVNYAADFAESCYNTDINAYKDVETNFMNYEPDPSPLGD